MSRKRVIAATLVAGFLLVVFSIMGAAFLISGAAEGRMYSRTEAIPHRRVGLLLGCQKNHGNGSPNLYFMPRVVAAAKLFKAGKVDFLLVSGDNHTVGYDETTDMKESLVQAGVPADRIVCDYAGFRTLDSVVRAKEVFGQDGLTIISQPFHSQRAIFIASHFGVDAIGFSAGDVDLFNGFRIRIREMLARVKAVMDVYLLRTQPRFLGEKIVIQCK